MGTESVSRDRRLKRCGGGGAWAGGGVARGHLMMPRATAGLRQRCPCRRKTSGVRVQYQASSRWLTRCMPPRGSSQALTHTKDDQLFAPTLTQRVTGWLSANVSQLHRKTQSARRPTACAPEAWHTKRQYYTDSTGSPQRGPLPHHVLVHVGPADGTHVERSRHCLCHHTQQICIAKDRAANLHELDTVSKHSPGHHQPARGWSLLVRTAGPVEFRTAGRGTNRVDGGAPVVLMAAGPRRCRFTRRCVRARFTTPRVLAAAPASGARDGARASATASAVLLRGQRAPRHLMEGRHHSQRDRRHRGSDSGGGDCQPRPPQGAHQRNDKAIPARR